MMKTTLKLILSLLISVTGLAHAEADGPDFYRVHGVASDDVLNIRSKADSHARKVGKIPPGSECVRNLGCKGGLSMEEFTNLSKREQVAAKRDHPRWCHIEYQGTEGWVAGRFLAEGSCDPSQTTAGTATIIIDGYAIDAGSERAGGDYYKDYARSVEECAAWCSSESRCKGFDYHKNLEACWVKEKIHPMQPNKIVVTGMKK
jgi:uncharacterized protein YgiM (DUF1202 family)